MSGRTSRPGLALGPNSDTCLPPALVTCEHHAWLNHPSDVPSSGQAICGHPCATKDAWKRRGNALCVQLPRTTTHRPGTFPLTPKHLNSVHGPLKGLQLGLWSQNGGATPYT